MDNNIFNFINRHQVLLEGVKKWYHADFLRYLRELANKLRSLLLGSGSDNLGDLTKAKFNKLWSKISEAVNLHLGAHANEFLTEFRRFTRIDTVLQRGAFSRIKPTIDFTSASIGSVWKAVNNDVVPAFGLTVKQKAEDFIGRSKDKIKKLVNRGQADSAEITAVVKELIGEGEDYAEGLLRTIAADARAFISTAFQHAAAKVSQTVGSLVYSCYQWVSVIDSKTSEVCRSRNGNVYRYGEGPVPPAHDNCRSRTIPCPCDDKGSSVPGMFAWLKTQPRAFLDAALGNNLAKRVVDGDATLTEITALGLIPKLTLDQFELKAGDVAISGV